VNLLERDVHLDALRAGLSVAAGGSGCVVLVSGEAGIGKTALIRQFVDETGDAARALWSGCESLFTPQPLAPLYDIARQAGGTLAEALDSASRREAVFQACLECLAGDRSPTIVVIEDLQWADDATLDLIKFLGRRMQRLPVMLVLSYRDDEVGARHPLHRVLGELPATLLRRIVLPLLTVSAVESLARAAGRDPAGLHEATTGNPLFVTEALAVPDGTIPPTVRDAVRARMARLSEGARAVADLVALLPGRAELSLLRQVLDDDVAAVDECLGAGLVAGDGRIGFRHEVVRRAVEDDVPLALRHELHARVFKALQGVYGTCAARLLHHADGAGDGAAVLGLASEAATKAAALGSHREAAAYLALALKYSETLPVDERAALLDRLSYEYYLTDRVASAFQARQEAVALWKTAGRQLQVGDGLRFLSRLAWFDADRASAERYADEAVATLEPLGAGRELAMAYSNLAQLHMLARDVEGALLWGRKAISLARTIGDSVVESHALNNVGTAKLVQGDESGRADLVRSLELAVSQELHEEAARAYANLSSTAIRQHDFPRAAQYLTQGLDYCEARDLDSWTRYLIAFRAEHFLATGDWQRAADDAESIVGHAETAAVTRIAALGVLARVRARRGDPGARPALDEAYELALATDEPQRVGPVLAARAEVAWLAGESYLEVEELRLAYERARMQPDPWLKGALAFWLWRFGHLDQPPEAAARPFALHMGGDTAAAARAWDALGCPYEQAIALTDSGHVSSLRSALEVFERLGATPMAAITRRQLRALGVRGLRRGPHERTTQNPHQLTRRELQVLSLLAEGHRNADIARRLFLAGKTVEHHVSAILSKLQVRSRGEASAVAHRLGLRFRPANGHAASH